MKPYSILIVALALALGGQGSPTSDNHHVSRTINIQPPKQAPPDAQIVPIDYMAYSIEYDHMVDFAGNKTQPNNFSYQLLKNLQDASGEFPIIRAGGSPQNRAFFVDSQAEAFIRTYPETGGNRLKNFTIGPAWLESFQTWPGVKWLVGLSFEDGELGFSQTVQQAEMFVKAIGKDIVGLEIGNEVDGFPGLRRPENWTTVDYVDEWLARSEAVSAAVQSIAPDVENLQEPLFQACSFLEPEHIGTNLSYWNVQSALRLGINDGGRVKSLADHKYAGSVCADLGLPIPKIGKTLLDHHYTTNALYYHEYLGNWTYEQGLEYVMGETGTVSCHGMEDVSDTYASALWAVDYLLYLASLKVSRVYFHQGTGFFYNAWEPVANVTAGTGASARPMYYGNLLTAHALGHSQSQVVMLKNESSFVTYGIYEAKSAECGPAADDILESSALKSLVVLNLEEFNSTQSASERTSVAIRLPKTSLYKNANVRRLTGPGAEAKAGMTFAGQSVDQAGHLVGIEHVEKPCSYEVVIGASEAVLITL